MTAISSVTPSANSLWERWFTFPDDATPAERRFNSWMSVIFPFGVLIHTSFILLFAYWDVWPLVIANVFSVGLWIAAAVAWRKAKLSLTLALIVFEVFAHSTLALIMVGWGFGAQYFLYPVLIGIVLLSWWPRWLNLGTIFILAGSFVLYYFYAELYPPLFIVSPVQLSVAYIVNTVASFVIIALGALFLVAETERSEITNEALLNNVLPKPIVARLKVKNSKGRIANPDKRSSEGIAESFSAVSVLFADVVGFTTLSEQLSPQDTVDLLNELFIAFDKLAEKYGVEKIRTIGDGYMVAAGAPLPLDDHAQALAAMALEMQDYMKRRETTADVPLQVRIGINSGPAVAGIVGTTKFHYDLWGDMVNTASRMESHGVPGKIQIARPTYELIKNDFHCEPRGMLEVKGKGEMEAWFVTRARSGLSEKVL
jgi:adenylate cyclase